MSKNNVDAPFDRSEEAEMNQNHYNKAIQSQFVGQWITSLAISVICCAILFVVFAGYMVRLHEKSNLAEIRIEVLQEKYNQIMTEIAALRRAPPQTVFNLQGVAPTQPQPQAPQPVVEPPAPEGVKIEETPKAEDDSMQLQEPAPEPTPEPAAPVSNKSSRPKMDLGVPTYKAPENMAPIVR